LIPKIASSSRGGRTVEIRAQYNHQRLLQIEIGKGGLFERDDASHDFTNIATPAAAAAAAAEGAVALLLATATIAR
jgi:hypothetical protein